MKYPIGKQTFSTLIEEGMVYVDKTDLVYQLAQKNICFFCRPRRFGKSLLISTLESYFKGEKELFRGLKIETEGLEYEILAGERVQRLQPAGRYKHETRVRRTVRNN